MVGSIKSIFHSFTFFQKKTPKRTSKKVTVKPKDYRAQVESISIQVDKRFLLEAEKRLDQIILMYVPITNNPEQQKIHKLIVKSFGDRAEYLGKKLSKEFLIAPDTAKKLAQHSLSFLSAKYSQARYQDIGIEKYRWSTGTDSRVHEDHKVLHGKIFAWDSPPIADKKTGDRYNPGEFPDCSCTAIPILE